MDLKTIVDVLNARVDDLSKTNMFFGLQTEMGNCIELEKLIRACGHDTSELMQAINCLNLAYSVLVKTRDQTVKNFKTNGICFTVDESKRQELEESRLQ